MTTMNNEDPADPSVHEPRELPEPAAWRVRGYAQFKTGKPGPWRFVDSAMLPTVQTPEDCDFDALYTADQMREAIAAERERQTKPPKWWTCPTHGDAKATAWGCPECVREMRSELDAHDARELEQAERIAELEARLKEIGDYAHDNSTGPAVPDALWTIREMAYDG